MPTAITMDATLSLTCASSCTGGAATLTYDSLASTLTVGNIFTGGNAYVTSGATVTFDVTGFVNPSSTGTFSMDIASYEMVTGATPYIIDTISGVELEIRGTVLDRVKTNPWMRLFKYYRIAFTCDKDVLTGYVLRLTFPDTFSIEQPKVCKIRGLTTGYLCTTDAGNVIEVTDWVY